MYELQERDIRQMRRMRAHDRLTPAVAGADDWCGEVAREVLASDLDTSQLAALRNELAAYGYWTCRLVSLVCNWIADQPITELTFSRTVHRCQRCHRELIDPESIARGYGPECAALANVA